MKILPIIPSNVSKHLYQGWALRSSRLNPHHDPIIGNIDKTWMYCFRDRYQQTRFKKILRENFDPLLLKSLLAVYMIVYIPSAVMSFRARRIADEGSLALASLAVLSIIFLLLIPGCSVIYIRWKRLHMKRAAQTPAATIDRLLTRWEPLIEKAFMIGAAVSHGLSLFARIYDGGQCNQYEIDGVLSSLFCNPEALIGALPQDSAFALVLVPCFLSQAVKGISWRASILAWLVGFISLIICVAYAHAWQRSGFLLVFSIFEAVRMLILHKQDMRMYISGLEKQKAVLEKLEAENKIVQAMELRNLIANMAHDLKSPLQAFSNSMTTMESIVSEVAQWSETSDNAFDRLIGCLRVLEDMTATNQFMAMTINRAIDYSKASHGITLMPTYRSLDIVDIINWPIRCMKSLQSSQVINIYCHPLPDDVFPYCITDGQWLQENMLCLLSNAVKFSFVGVVEIRISLVYEEKKIKSRGGAGSTRGGALAGDRDREGVVGSASPLLQLRTKSPMDAPSPSTSSAPACAERNQASPCPGAGNDHHRGGSGESSGSNAGAGSSGGGTGASAGSVSHPMIRYEVLDSGIGISPEAQATAFQPLNRSRTDRQSGGAGLGLYSLSKRVEALGGSCGIGPRPDGREGTLCWFTEPYRPDFSPTTAEGNLIDVSEATLRKLRSRKFSEDLSSSYTSMRFRGAGGEGSSPREPGSAVDQHHNISSLYVPQTQSSTHAAGNHHNHHQHHQHPHQTHLTHRETSLLLANPTVFPLQPSLSAGDFPPSPTSVTFDLMPTATAAHEEGQREGQGQIQRHHRLLSSSTSTSTEFNAVPSLQLLPSLPLKVLVVDDSPTILKTMARTLERSKHEVETAQNGAVALDLMKQKTYDAVLMDIQMPVMDGLEAVNLFRAYERTRTHRPLSARDRDRDLGATTVPTATTANTNTITNTLSDEHAHQFIIGVSANSDTETTTKAILAGMDEFMPKPFTMRTFENAVAAFLRNPTRATATASAIMSTTSSGSCKGASTDAGASASASAGAGASASASAGISTTSVSSLRRGSYRDSGSSKYSQFVNTEDGVDVSYRKRSISFGWGSGSGSAIVQQAQAPPTPRSMSLRLDTTTTMMTDGAPIVGGGGGSGHHPYEHMNTTSVPANSHTTSTHFPFSTGMPLDTFSDSHCAGNNNGISNGISTGTANSIANTTASARRYPALPHDERGSAESDTGSETRAVQRTPPTSVAAGALQDVQPTTTGTGSSRSLLSPSHQSSTRGVMPTSMLFNKDAHTHKYSKAAVVPNDKFT